MLVEMHYLELGVEGPPRTKRKKKRRGGMSSRASNDEFNDEMSEASNATTCTDISLSDYSESEPGFRGGGNEETEDNTEYTDTFTHSKGEWGGAHHILQVPHGEEKTPSSAQATAGSGSQQSGSMLGDGGELDIEASNASEALLPEEESRLERMIKASESQRLELDLELGVLKEKHARQKAQLETEAATQQALYERELIEHAKAQNLKMSQLREGSTHELNKLRKMIHECEKLGRLSWLQLDVRGVEADEDMGEAASAACGYHSKGMGPRSASWNSLLGAEHNPPRMGRRARAMDELIGVDCLGESVAEAVTRAAGTSTPQGKALGQAVADLALLRTELPLLKEQVKNSETQLQRRRGELDSAREELKRKQTSLDQLCGVGLVEDSSLTMEECDDMTRLHKEGMAVLAARREELRQREVAALEAEKRRAEIQNLCTVCCAQTLDTVFMPCMHLCCCSKCAEEATNCPVCNADIGSRLRTYLP